MNDETIEKIQSILIEYRKGEQTEERKQGAYEQIKSILDNTFDGALSTFLDSVKLFTKYSQHLDGCSYHMTEFCDCGYKEAKKSLYNAWMELNEKEETSV